MQNLVIDNQLEIARDVLSFGAATILNSQFEPARVLKSSGVMAVNFGAVEKDLWLFRKVSTCSQWWWRSWKRWRRAA